MGKVANGSILYLTQSLGVKMFCQHQRIPFSSLLTLNVPTSWFASTSL